MSSHPSSPHSSRLENLNLGPRGAAFELDGRPVRLDAEGYAAPVASFQEFYHQALADFYQRSAEITRQQAARPPLLGRLLSWIGGLFGRSASAPPVTGPATSGPPPLATAAPAAPAIPARAVPRPPEVSPRSPAPPSAEAGPLRPTPNAPESPQPPLLRSLALPPALAVVFADQAGLHVIWQLTPAKTDPARSGPERAGAKANPPRLELTYGLDSPLAQRLQDCYGQLSQLGYKIASLDAVRAAPEKAAAETPAPKATPEKAAATPAISVSEKPAVEIPKTGEAKPSSRKPRPEAAPARPEPEKLRPELPPRDPSFLPGI